MSQITDFRGSNFFLSNFWHVPITVKGITYKSVEHAYQALKTDDPTWRDRIINAPFAPDARRIGRCIPSSLIRKGWDDVRLDVMKVLIKKKFHDPHLQDLLLKTGDAEIIHENKWHDTFYGVCEGKGENHLGKLLMHTRHMLQEGLQAPQEAPAPQTDVDKPKAVKATRKTKTTPEKAKAKAEVAAPFDLMGSVAALAARS